MTAKGPNTEWPKAKSLGLKHVLSWTTSLATNSSHYSPSSQSLPISIQHTHTAMTSVFDEIAPAPPGYEHEWLRFTPQLLQKLFQHVRDKGRALITLTHTWVRSPHIAEYPSWALPVSTHWSMSNDFKSGHFLLLPRAQKEWKYTSGSHSWNFGIIFNWLPWW